MTPRLSPSGGLEASRLAESTARSTSGSERGTSKAWTLQTSTELAALSLPSSKGREKGEGDVLRRKSRRTPSAVRSSLVDPLRPDGCDDADAVADDEDRCACSTS